MTKYFDMHRLDAPIALTDDLADYCLSVDTDSKHMRYPFMSFPIIKACNFRCVYCGVGGESTASVNAVMDIGTIKKFVGLASSVGITKYRVTGGEPFLHPQIDEILRFFGESGFYTLVNTNGSLLKKHEKLIESLADSVRFAVSFDTFKPDLLKKISGNDSVASIKEGIELLRKHNKLLRLNTVVNKFNIDEIYDILDYCRQLNCDLKILDIVSVPVPYSENRQELYCGVDSLEKDFAKKCDEIYSHEYTRSYGTPCFRYRFGNVFVTVKNSKKGSHYDIRESNALCQNCKYFPCHEGLYDIFCLADERLCSCRWTEEQRFSDPIDQLHWLIQIFNNSDFIMTGSNNDMVKRTDI